MLTTVVGAGLLAGSIHALTGPDHLAAVAPLSVAESRRGAWRVGIRWGLGHALGSAALVSAALFLRGLLPLKAVRGWTEPAVGLMLVLVGVWGLRSALGRRHPPHLAPPASSSARGAHLATSAPLPPGRGDYGQHSRRVGPHPHALTRFARRPLALPRPAPLPPGRGDYAPLPHAALGVGIVHGLAGTTHLVALLPALALPTGVEGVAYLCGYGAGNLVAMGVFTSLIGMASAELQSSTPWGHRAALGACSVATTALGLVWAAI